MSKKRLSPVRPPPRAERPQPPQKLDDGAANVTDTNIARRAYDFYLARGCEHGHDVDDWLRAEQELRRSV